MSGANVFLLFGYIQIASLSKFKGKKKLLINNKKEPDVR